MRARTVAYSPKVMARSPTLARVRLASSGASPNGALAEGEGAFSDALWFRQAGTAETTSSAARVTGKAERSRAGIRQSNTTAGDLTPALRESTSSGSRGE